jgi:phosphopantothenoylcysteine decarboxylase/phosphopantothenate--cysteine ligase
MIVVNDVTAKDAGFDVDTNRVTLIFRDGAVHELPLLTKDEVADELLDRVRMIRGKDNELHC